MRGKVSRQLEVTWPQPEPIFSVDPITIYSALLQNLSRTLTPRLIKAAIPQHPAGLLFVQWRSLKGPRKRAGGSPSSDA